MFAFKVATAALATHVAAGEGQCCYGSCGEQCQQGWCAESEEHCTGNCKMLWCPDGHAPSGPTPSPASPSPGPPTPSGGHGEYCPDPASDFVADYGTPIQWSSSGWTITGGARASSKASYNLAGGFIEFDMDLGGAHGGVNNNVYLTFPTSIGQYCDSGQTGGCAELDFIENNGNCAAATTFHAEPNGGDKGGAQTVNGISSHVHVHASWDASGDSLTIMVDGNRMTGPGNPGNEMKSRGAVIYSSQWTGWVPGNCGGDGNLDASSFSVSNLRIKGAVVNGPQPRLCSARLAEISNATSVSGVVV